MPELVKPYFMPLLWKCKTNVIKRWLPKTLITHIYRSEDIDQMFRDWDYKWGNQVGFTMLIIRKRSKEFSNYWKEVPFLLPNCIAGRFQVLSEYIRKHYTMIFDEVRSIWKESWKNNANEVTHESHVQISW